MRIKVYTFGANPAVDQPLRFDPPAHAAHLVAMGRATILGRRSIQLRPTNANVSPKVLAAAGYDHCVSQNPAEFFEEVWEHRKSAGIAMLQYIGNGNQRRD